MAYLTIGKNKIIGSSVSTDDNVVTVIDENSTDEQVPSAKAVHTAIQNVSGGVPVNAYTKEEVDDLLDDKANVDDLVESYSKDEVDNLLNDKANVTDTYNKTEIDALLDGKANTDDVTTNGYTKEEVDNLLANKADSSAIVDSYTKDEVNDLLDDKANTTALDNYVLSDELDNYALTSSVYNKTEVDDLLTAKVNTTSVVTTLSSNNVDEEIPSAKAVYDAIQNVSAGVPADVYSKTEIDNLLDTKADTDAIVDAYNKTEVDDLLAGKANATDIVDAYTKDEVNTLLDDKVNVDDLVDAYSKTEVDNLLANKADSDTIVDSYSKDEVDDLLADKADTSAIIDAYTKDETNDLLDAKVNVDDLVETYSKDEIDGLLADKANTDDLVDAYDKTEVDGLLTDKVNTSSVVTILSSSSTDEEIPSAKTVFDAIQSVSAGVPADVYSKTDVDNLLANKADTDDLVDAYSKTEVDGLLANKADSSAIIDAYTKDEVNDLLDDKANADDIIDAYTKTEVDGLLTAKVDTTALDGKLDKTAIVTSLSSTNTDEQVPSALATKAYVDSKEVKISTEENNKIETKDDGIFVSKDYVEITQAEYDLLTEEEKEDIVFYITDASGNSELVTVINENSTDKQVPSAKAVYTAIQNVSVGVPADVYSKTEVDDLLADKADSTDIVDAYTKDEVDNLLNAKVNADDVVDAYSKTEVDNLLDGKADSDTIVDAYSKTEVDNLLDTKADTSAIIDAYNKTEVDGLLADKANVDDLVDSYSKTETDGLLATKADTTALDSKINKTAIVTSVSSTSTDKQVPSAKAVHTAIQEAKTDLESEIANIPKVTKTSELTNDSGFITANDIPDVDLEPYALKTQIPTTLPASDVYAWAKEATKPTYTASEVGALASDGTAVNASKVEKALTLKIAGTTKNTYNGSTAQFFNIPNASTSESGVMTADMVTKLNGIATGANLIKTSQNNASVTTSSGFSPTITTCIIGNNTVGSVWIITGTFTYNISSAPSAGSTMFSINQQITQYKEETICCPCLNKENAYLTVSIKNGTFYYKSYTGTAPTSSSRYFISAVIPVSSNSFVSS